LQNGNEFEGGVFNLYQSTVARILQESNNVGLAVKYVSDQKQAELSLKAPADCAEGTVMDYTCK
jgi:hypothetical protein